MSITVRMRIMRIFIYALNYSPEPIGIPVYTAGMAKWLVARQNWSVTVRTGTPHYPWWSIHPDYSKRNTAFGSMDEILEGVKVERVRHYIPSLPLTGLKRIRLDASWIIATMWRSWFTKNKPQALVVVSPPFFCGILGVFLSWHWRIPIIYHVQDLQVDAALELKLLPSWMGWILLRCEKFILQHVDLVTTISAGMARRISSKGPTRNPVQLFPNWVNPKVMEQNGQTEHFRAQWKAGAGLVIMYSGNLGAKQGLDVLIDAIALLPLTIPFLVIIAGTGPERVELERKVNQRTLSRIQFQDLIDVDQLGDFLRAADIHVIPQRRAAAGLVMPSKLLNIMAVGRPVIVTAEFGTDLANMVNESRGGLVVEPESPTALAHALEQLMSNRQQREDCGDAARNYILSRYTIDRVVETFARSVSTIVHRHQRGRSERITNRRP